MEINNFLSSEIYIDNKIFKLDTISINPECFIKNRKCDFPLNIAGCSQFYYFYTNQNEYIIINTQPPCNGSYCRNNILILFQIKNGNIKLFLIANNILFPFKAEDLFLGDINKDNKIDFYYFNEMNERYTYKMTVMSLNSNNFDILKDKNNKNYEIIYKCLNCSGMETDSLLLQKNNWIFFLK
jgi:hypothetical protein